MIAGDEELRLAGKVRASILESIGGIKDSQGYWTRFRDPSPNWLTANRIETIILELEAGLIALGAVRYVIHAPCGATEHCELAQDIFNTGKYWRMVIEDGRTDAEFVKSGIIEIDGVKMETSIEVALSRQATTKLPCPCHPENPAPEHSTASYFLWPTNELSRLNVLAEISLVLRDARNKSKDRKSRSGIRELLQQALIQLERLIVDESADEILRRRGV